MSGLQDYARRFLAERAAARPAQAAAGPKAGQAGGGGARLVLALPAPGGGAPDDAPSVRLLDELRKRFDELLHRLETDAGRDGLHDDGPMTRVLRLLQLCMATLCELTDLNIRTTDRHADQVVGAIQGAERQAKVAVELARASLAGQMATEQDQFADRIANRVVVRAERSIERRAQQFPLKAAFLLAVALFGSNAATGWLVYDRTVTGIEAAAAAARDGATKQTLATIHETEAGLRAAFAAETLTGASRWLGLMQWNRIGPALAQCASNPDLSSTSADGRRSCAVPLWTEPAVPVQRPWPAQRQ